VEFGLMVIIRWQGWVC